MIPTRSMIHTGTPMFVATSTTPRTPLSAWNSPLESVISTAKLYLDALRRDDAIDAGIFKTMTQRTIANAQRAGAL
jgi:hypothetical protein